jgi:hypothetical protein
VKIDAQIVAVRAAQGTLGIERSMLSEAFAGPPAPTSSPGVNATKRLALSDGATVFRQTDETPPLHDAVAWRVAVALGEPWQSLVSPCVLREHDGDDGALSLQASGWPGDLAPTLSPTWCSSAAFFDSLIAQQDRHADNWRWDGSRLTLIDHGYAFARPGDILNHTDLLVARRDHGATALLDAERRALERLLGYAGLLGIESLLLPDRAQALRARAERMLARGEVLRPGEF